MTVKTAKRLRELIEMGAAGLPDKEASEGPQLFPQLQGNGNLIKLGTRINWNGEVMRAATDLWDTTENDPAHAPTLWESIGYKQGYRIIPETITAGTAFSEGELGWWGDTLYKSLLPSNVYTPEQYSLGWEEVN